MEALFTQAVEIYNAKMRTGHYDHYDAALLEILFTDCLTQAVAMHHINAHRNEAYIASDLGLDDAENATYRLCPNPKPHNQYDDSQR
jgi:hypothetical protein